jgi:inner membrane protein
MDIYAIPGLKDVQVFSSGISFPFSLNGTDKNIPFDLTLYLSGSEELKFSPVGKITSVSLSSPWNSPGFTGNFLPASPTLTAAFRKSGQEMSSVRLRILLGLSLFFLLIIIRNL